jgi:hypothetical protein
MICANAGRLAKCLLMVMAGCMCFPGCDIIDDIFNKKDDGISDEEIAQIREDYETIDLTAREIVLEDVIDTVRIAALIEEYLQLKSVEDAWLDIDGIVVKFKKYGLAFWTYKKEFIDPPFFDIDTESQVNTIRSQILATSSRAGETKILPTNNKVGIFCGLSRDIDFEAEAIKKLEEIERDLKQSDYDVYSYYGERFTVDAFKAGLKEFGTIIIGSHGTVSGTDINNINKECTIIPPHTSRPDQHVWIRTGETHGWFIKEKQEFTRKYDNDFQNERLAYNNNNVIIFSEKLIKDEFKDHTLPNTLFYTFSCYGMYSGLLGKVMEKKRKDEGVTIGYDDTNSVGPATAQRLFEKLLGGNTVKEAFDNLESHYKKSPEKEKGREFIAYLEYYPLSGGNVTLKDTVPLEIIIQNPVDGGIYSEQLPLLEGKCRGFGKVESGTVSIGESTYPLKFINDSAFFQNIVIEKGENVIKINCVGKGKDLSVPVVADTEFRIVGDFNYVLFSTLKWDTDGTDVDLHLVGPDGTDCYFDNKQTPWGGILDIDDVNGRGPEHITIPVLKQMGTYRLYAHYYDPKGNGSSRVWVDLETPAGKKYFGPHTLTAKGDTWHICDISFRSLSPPYDATINATGLRAAGSGIFENLPAKKE